ncbi:MAG TPA: hypothetical protein VKQ27_11095, partial [Acetobacteraceae bacterium]|nr:hypothetical protein [Acetobacteraceae bacterium]
MISLTDPWLADALARWAPHGMIADWLDDQGAAIADVLRLFAGTAPEFIDGLHLPVVLAFAHAHGLAAEADKAKDLREMAPVTPQGVLDMIEQGARTRQRAEDLHCFAGYARKDVPFYNAVCFCERRIACWSLDGYVPPPAPVAILHLEPSPYQRPRPFLSARCEKCGRIAWSVYPGPEHRDWKRAVAACFGCSGIIPPEPPVWGVSWLRG